MILKYIVGGIILIILLCNCKTICKSGKDPLYPPVFMEDTFDLTNFIKKHRINEEGQIIRKEIKVIINDSVITHKEKPFETFVFVNEVNRKRTDFEREKVMIVDGYPEGAYVSESMDNTLISVQNNQQGLTGTYSVRNLQDSILYKTTFKDGAGYWKDFYYGENAVKEEGRVLNNFKTGTWKYYSKDGGLDSLKNYEMTDSIDVRFPYCLFNRKEPCF